MAESTLVLPEIEYPESDGKPMGETDVHRREIAAIIAMLELYFQNVANVYVSGNLMLYYEQGNPSAVTSPDVFVVKGISNESRRIYRLWQEQRPPNLVIEVSSRSTRLEDKGNKRALYAMLGVREYFLFDPLQEYLKPALQGFRLADDEYISIAPDQNGALTSEELGLRLQRENAYLRLFDVETGQRLLRPSELDAARRAAEAENERLRAELARLRGEQQHD